MFDKYTRLNFDMFVPETDRDMARWRHAVASAPDSQVVAPRGPTLPPREQRKILATRLRQLCGDQIGSVEDVGALNQLAEQALVVPVPKYSKPGEFVLDVKPQSQEDAIKRAHRFTPGRSESRRYLHYVRCQGGYAYATCGTHLVQVPTTDSSDWKDPDMVRAGINGIDFTGLVRALEEPTHSALFDTASLLRYARADLRRRKLAVPNWVKHDQLVVWTNGVPDLTYTGGPCAQIPAPPYVGTICPDLMFDLKYLTRALAGVTGPVRFETRTGTKTPIRLTLPNGELHLIMVAKR